MNDIPPPSLPLLAAISLAPRRTMRWMLDHPAPRQSFAIVVAAVLSLSLGDLDLRSASEAAALLGMSATASLAVFVLAVMLLAAVIAFFVFAAAATAAGRMLGGHGTFGAVRTAAAWGLAPQVWALFYRLPALVFWPDAVRTLHGGGKPGLEIGSEAMVFRPIDLSSVSFVPFAVYGSLELLALIWYLVVGSSTLAEAQGFSPWRGLANLAVAVVLPFVAILAIVAAAFLAFRTT
ncbi:MAG TPA: YIP1 family protein [Thermoanaerobaculia bacterium]|nr:YIP1 family protein [Thermoanaerobaculia bacterium]